MDPFDWMGRRCETESNAKPLDTSGDSFRGPIEYSATPPANPRCASCLGRALQDANSCTVQVSPAPSRKPVTAPALVREIALSVPFRNNQGEALPTAPKTPRPIVIN